jgi:hypothetical protein
MRIISNRIARMKKARSYRSFPLSHGSQKAASVSRRRKRRDSRCRAGPQSPFPKQVGFPGQFRSLAFRRSATTTEFDTLETCRQTLGMSASGRIAEVRFRSRQDRF